ncbi:IclR family transcriptional regulator [Clostridium fermenticellae]|uniref:IclR family transcriptional regulator n=1 Tax=Clostridium fermenticellae TaxID=2068654 RepID=A0A386H4C8_9CLOT|nr:IclR family transcriptional regulator [Clostridium fermenticellae]AYD40530.1 IclR family transcriptional regulator [Clostridium fermenticellae]
MEIENDTSYVKSVIKTLLILDQFSSPDEKGIIELSENTHLPASTVQRIVNTLELKNYLMQNPKTHKYRLGIALYNISKNYSKNLEWIDGAKIYMEKLVEKHGETVNLAILQGKKIIYLTKVDSPNILRPNFEIGVEYPALCTSLGRSILAFQPPEILNKIIIPSNIEHNTDKTITDTKDIWKELSKIKEDGYAIEDEEFQTGLFCIGVPIIDYKGRSTAAISTTIPKYRVDLKKIPDIVKDMLDAAKNISDELTKAY